MKKSKIPSIEHVESTGIGNVVIGPWAGSSQLAFSDEVDKIVGNSMPDTFWDPKGDLSFFGPLLGKIRNNN